MMPTPTRATPAGCVVVLFGLAAWVYTGLCCVVIHMEHHLPVAKQDSHVIRTWEIHGVLSFVAGLLMLWFGLRWAVRADMSDPDDPTKPKVRF
jgi:hypothetical protein